LKPLREREQSGRLGIRLASIARILHFPRQARQCIHDCEDRKRAVLASDFECVLGELPRDAAFGQGFRDFVGAIAEPRLHRFHNRLGEAVAPLIAFRDQSFDHVADVRQALMHVGRVLARVVHNLDGVPDDVILADSLEPECLHAHRAAADLRIPQKEPRRKRFAADLRPAERIDQETEHVLFPAVQPGSTLFVGAAGLLRWLKIRRELANHRQQIDVVQPSVTCAVDRSYERIRGVELQRLRARCQCLVEDAGRRVGRQAVPRVQFKRSQHSQYFPLGSVERYCGAPGGTGHQVHDPASTFQPFTPWPDSEDVVVRYVPPAAVMSIEWLAVITSHDLYPMTEVEPGVWEATTPARTQGEHGWWFLLGNFNGQPQLRHDPFIGVDAQGDELEPVRRGAISDPEHIGTSIEQRHADDAYYFVFYSHYNPYASGLPELLDENAPGTPGSWLRRGTDSYEFDSSENIQPGLINLARFVLDHIGARVQHHPSGRGDPELCCQSMPIVWRWSGANTPDLYRGGGKGGTAGSSPLHNHPAHGDAGSSDARKSWRGIEMAWQNAGDVPGFFPDNWYYGDNESWLTWEDRLTLDPDPLNPPFEAIIRDYGGRGLRAGDAIDPVFLLEIIDAVDYLISNGLVVQVPIHTAPRTPLSSEVWNTPCGERHEWGWYHNYIDSNFDEQWDYTEVDPEGLCCQSVGPAPDYDCDPYERPSWAECTGSGKCHLGRQRWKSCTDDQTPDPVSANENNREIVSCNVLNQAGVWELYEIYNGHTLGGWIRNAWSPTARSCRRCVTARLRAPSPHSTDCRIGCVVPTRRGTGPKAMLSTAMVTPSRGRTWRATSHPPGRRWAIASPAVRCTPAPRPASMTMSKIIGIDLGTTNSVVAVMEGDTPKVLTNAQGAAPRRRSSRSPRRASGWWASPPAISR
jgi:hypothetical protein